MTEKITDSSKIVTNELVSLRAENTKTFDLGNGKRQLLASIGAIHYKDNYADKDERWKDIDLTWEGDKITKAPYELTHEGNKITIRDKKSGEVSTIELIEVGGILIPTGIVNLDNVALDTDLEIVAEDNRVRFTRVLRSDKAPKEAKFRITGKIPLIVHARDASEGITKELPVETTLVDGILTETLKPDRVVKYPVRIDPTWSAILEDDDCESAWNTGTGVWDFWRPSRAGQTCGYYSANEMKIGGGMRWRNVNIPQGATILASSLVFTCRDGISATVVNTRITGENVDDAAAFSDLANFQARRGIIVGGANDDFITTAQVDWDAIGAWVTNTEYTSPEIKTIIQEQINRGGWAGDALVLFWDDFDNRSTNAAARYRQGYSWAGDPNKTTQLVITYTVVPRLWLSGWGKRIKLTVDQNDITAALSNFPILVYLSTSSGRNGTDVSCVFDELQNDANRKKIAVTTSDGETECYVEIEKWDDANEKAWLWIKVSTVASGADTELYLYYDVDHADNDAYVGDTNSTPAENVWDDNFVLVCHMRNDPDNEHVRDSTQYDNDGTKGAVGEPTLITNGQIGEAQNFDGGDNINFGNAASLAITGDITLEAYGNPDDVITSPRRLWDATGSRYGLGGGWTSGKWGLWMYIASAWREVVSSVSVTTAWHYVVGRRTGSAMSIIVDLVATTGSYAGALGTAGDVLLGVSSWLGDADEGRISNIARPDAWIKASYESEIDDLLAFGSEEIYRIPRHGFVNFQVPGVV